MFENIPFTQRDGDRSPADITVLALSTCGFCRSALEFLDRNRISYRFVHVDTLPPEVKGSLKGEFAERFNEKLVYPTMILNDSDYLQGFVQASWERTLGL